VIELAIILVAIANISNTISLFFLVRDLNR